MTRIMACGVLIISVCTAIPASSLSADSENRWSIETGPAVFIPDREYYEAGASPGMSASLEFDINGSFSLIQRFGYFIALAGDDNFEIFNNMFLIRFIPARPGYFHPFIECGVSFITGNPSAATGSRKTFKPAQTVFCLGAGGGIIISGLTERFDISASVHVEATPYKYRKYKFDVCRVIYEESQFTHAIASIGIVYGF